MSPAGLRALLLLSVLAAVVTIVIKALAYSLTHSVGLLSDALESGINLIAAVTAYLSLHYSHRPVDATHTYGHQKIEFFSTGLEGVLIVVAGVGTAWIAVGRLVHSEPLAELGLGTGLALGASVVNLAVGLVLVRVGRRHHSIVLEADGRHPPTSGPRSAWSPGSSLCGLAGSTSSTRSSPSWSGPTSCSPACG